METKAALTPVADMTQEQLVELLEKAVQGIYGHIPKYSVNSFHQEGNGVGLICYDLDNGDRWGFTVNNEYNFQDVELSINSNKMTICKFGLVKMMIQEMGIDLSAE